MAKIFFQGWVGWKRTGSGFLALEVREQHRAPIREALTRLRKFEEKKGPRLLNVHIEIAYKKRTDGMNRLLWALLEVVANEHNSQVTTGDTMRDSDYFYRLFLVRYAPRETADSGEVMIRTSSGFNTVEMGTFIDRIFDELAVMDIQVSSPVEISSYWEEHRIEMSKRQVILRANEQFTVEEYKAAVLHCEACGVPVWHEDVGSSLAHIKAVGMGGGRTYKVYGRMVMHLCDVCHAEFDNGKGRAAFMVKHPGVEYKIKTALRMDVEGAEDDENIEGIDAEHGSAIDTTEQVVREEGEGADSEGTSASDGDSEEGPELGLF